jgi:phenylpropionate dioxygenase-like ring-hydroxylating dioxygenase large terminal subunit
MPGQPAPTQARSTSRDALIAMTRRTLEHARAGTVPLTDTVARVDAARYYDPARAEAERRAIFRRLPLVLAFSCQLREPHAYTALEVAGVPVLLTRSSDGAVRGFVNMCSHRGAMVVPEGTGSSRRFACPYHGWTYDGGGALVGIVDRTDFGELDPSCKGLVPLPVAERAGIVFGCVTPDAELDIDTFLCGYGEVLDELGLDRCHHVGSQRADGPNWKIAYDGYLDFYHLPVLHRNTFGPRASNKAIYDAWGPHQRVSSPDRRTAALDGVPEDEWPDVVLTGGVWTVFPHTSIAGFPVHAPSADDGGNDDGGLLYMASTLYPGPDAASSVTVQHFLADFEPTAAIAPRIAAQQEFLLRVVQEEDYFTGNRIQRALQTGFKRDVFFGRNELGGQRFHRWVDAVLAAPSDAELRRLFESAEVEHQC